MSFLTPGALLWLLSIPVLLWLWRLASTRRQLRIPSLIPFEHLLKRPLQRRTRLLVNLLFWLQLAALVGLATALAQPVFFQRRTKTVLVVLDTSASMAARGRVGSAWEQAKRAALARVARKAPADQVLLVTTAPVASLTPQPTSDAAELARVLEEARITQLSGNLSTTARIGRSLLAAAPDETVVITDEPMPTEPLSERVRFLSVGEPVPNVALIGLDAQGPLCSPAEARLIATVHNFSQESQRVTVTAVRRAHQLAETTVELPANGRQSVPLTLPEDVEGWVEVTVRAPHDGLASDNRAWVELHRTAALPVLLQASRSSIQQTVATWLDACDALRWSAQHTSDRVPSVVISDAETAPSASAAALLQFLPPEAAPPLASPWVVAADHPITAYLTPVEVVAAPLNLAAGVGRRGTVVVSALVQGRNVPVIIADEREGRRVVTMLLDPSGSAHSTSVVLAFFNSLRWLMGGAGSVRVGEPLTLGGFERGAVRVSRPDGWNDTVESDGGTVRYDETSAAGLYRFSQGRVERGAAANFFDPLESNVWERGSTWTGTPALSQAPGEPRAPLARHPLASCAMLAVLVLLLVEWRLYSRRRP